MPGGLGDLLGQPRVVGVDDVQRHARAERQNPLVEPSVVLDEYRAQGLVPVDDVAEGVLKSVDVQCPADTEHQRVVVRHPGLAEAVQNQQTLLRR